jgi:hypothetical protein
VNVTYTCTECRNQETATHIAQIAYAMVEATEDAELDKKATIRRICEPCGGETVHGR